MITIDEKKWKVAAATFAIGDKADADLDFSEDLHDLKANRKGFQKFYNGLASHYPGQKILK